MYRVYSSGEKRAVCKNHRPNIHSVQMPGACPAHQGQIIADLHDPDTGEFIRAAVVADVGASGLEAAKRYCEAANAKHDTPENDKQTS